MKVQQKFDKVLTLTQFLKHNFKNFYKFNTREKNFKKIRFALFEQMISKIKFIYKIIFNDRFNYKIV